MVVAETATHIDFVGARGRWYRISAVLVGASLLALVVLQLNLGIEFRGGVSIQTENPAGATLADVRSAMGEIGLDQTIVQLINGGEAVRIETTALDEAGQEEFRQAVSEVTGATSEDLSLKAVEPRFGALIARQAIIALVVFLTAVAFFISWRLEFKMALAALAALAHDLLITAGVYAVTRFEVTTATIVALLTILGYSLYDTVVVFDRVSEVDKTAPPEMGYEQVVNHSMNQVLIRSVATSLTSLLPVGSLLFVGSLILGAATLRDFALALFVGIASGTYSSLFVAGPILAALKTREPHGGRHQITGKGRPTTRRDRRTLTSGATRSRGSDAAPRPPRSPRPPRPPKRGR